jgi:hypothetical protein
MSTWRETYRVHPAADAFPMMSDEELIKLGDDIRANGMRVPIRYYQDRNAKVLIDGRNRLEAMERAGVEPKEWEVVCAGAAPFDAVHWIVSLNLHRRHLTQEQRADLIVAAHKAATDVSRQDGVKLSKRGRAEGRTADAVKAAAVATAADHGIGKRTVERSFARAEGRLPKPKPKPSGEASESSDPAYVRLLKAFHQAPVKARRRLAWNMDSRLISDNGRVGIDAARRYYLECVEHLEDLDAEQAIVLDALRELAGKRAMVRAAP